MPRLTAQDFFTRTGRRERSEPVDRQDAKVDRGTDGCRCNHSHAGNHDCPHAAQHRLCHEGECRLLHEAEL